MATAVKPERFEQTGKEFLKCLENIPVRKSAKPGTSNRDMRKREYPKGNPNTAHGRR
jgi:hypothetical protein